MLLIEKIVFMEYNEGKELAEIMKFFFKKIGDSKWKT